MTAQEIWNQLVHKTPHLASDQYAMQINSYNLKKLLFQVHAQGVIEGQKPETGGNPLMEMLMGAMK